MERILVIDDDVKLCELLTEYLTTEGFLVETVNDAASGTNRAHQENFDLIILDVMLSGMNGLDVLQNLRGSIATPVMMLTARGDDVDRIVGLELGADDYLPKPFNPRELVARIRAILRRSKPDRDSSANSIQKIKVGDLEMDLTARVVLCSNKHIDLTSAEFNLLECLLRSAGKLVSREELTGTVFGRALSPFDRSIDVHVSKIRKKLGTDPSGMDRIKTIRSAGYLYAIAAEIEPESKA